MEDDDESKKYFNLNLTLCRGKILAEVTQANVATDGVHRNQGFTF